MIGVVLIAAATATSFLVAAAFRLPSLVSTLLVAYLAFVANLGLVTLALSPFQCVTSGGLAVAEAALLVGALVTWWRRGRPGLPLAAARPAAARILGDPITLLFLGVVVAVLAYELALALTVPPNNGDSLTYHLARAAAWAQHGGIHWIENAPTDRLNEFQPLAEQQILFFFVATGNDGLFALPQYLAQLAILLAVYGSARRLGFEACAAAAGALLFATFTLVAVEATTAQNDLVAASFPAVAVCLILGRSRVELALAGAAVGLGLGAKLTTALVLPVLAWLVAKQGRRAALAALGGLAAGFAAIGMWSFVLNVVNTGELLGHGGGRLEHTAWPPSYPDSLRTVLFLLYETLDLSLLSDRLIRLFAVAGSLAAVLAAVLLVAGRRRTASVAACVAVPLLAPLLVLGGGRVLAALTDLLGFPARGPEGRVGGLNRTSNEDYSAFGPIGAIVLLGVSAFTVLAYLRRRVDVRHLALAVALPSFVVLLALYAGFNYWMPRFLLVPAALTAPLLATLFWSRTVTAAYVVVSSVVVYLLLVHIPTKPLDGPDGRPWEITRAEASTLNGLTEIREALPAFERAVPPRACVGAVMDGEEPTYLFWGAELDRRISYLPVHGAVNEALRRGLFYVVISSGPNGWVADEFRAAGWDVRKLGDYWPLAVAPGAATGDCSAD